MKTIVTRFSGSFLFVCSLLFIFTFIMNNGARAETDKDETRSSEAEIKVYVHLGFGDETDSQYSFIYKDIFETAFDKLKLTGKYRYIKDEAEFIKAVETDRPTAIYAGSREHVIHFITELDYEPVWSYTTYGLDDIATCIYVSKESGINDVSELNGKSISMNKTTFEYILLRGVVDAPPEDFFSYVDLTKIGPSPAYSMKLEELDAMFLSEQIYEFLKRNNPGIVAGLKKLECSFDYEFLPIVVVKDFDEVTFKAMDKVLKRIFAGKIRTKATTFLKFQEFNGVNVSIANYQNIIDYYKQAEENGWIDDYKYWLNSLEE